MQVESSVRTHVGQTVLVSRGIDRANQGKAEVPFLHGEVFNQLYFFFMYGKYTHQLGNDEWSHETSRGGIDVDVDIPSSLSVLLLEFVVERLDIFVLTGVSCAENSTDKDCILC